MATYKYRAKKGPDDVTEGLIEAQGEREAIDKISAMGFFPLSVEPVSRAPEQPQPKRSATFSFGIKSGEITVFSRQLASLLRSGMPILSSLNIIAEQSDNRRLKEMLSTVHNSVKEGATFSSSLAGFPRVFSPLYIAMIRAGEGSGSLPEVLLRIADYRAKQEEVVLKFRTAMAYPVLMALVGVGTVTFMLTFVMPRLIGIFSNLGERLPLPTRILIFISGAVRQYGLAIVIAAAVLILLLGRYSRTKLGRVSLGAFVLRLPLVGKLIFKNDLARFSRTLEMLNKGGIPILQAIDIATGVLQNQVIKNQLKVSYRDLEQGGSFGRSLKNSKMFPVFMTNLIIVGEESGKLNEALAELAQSYERDTDEAIRIFASLLEPLMILGMGLIVGFIVVAMLLPIFEINVIAR
jgi:general secretion pathway protein F